MASLLDSYKQYKLVLEEHERACGAYQALIASNQALKTFLDKASEANEETTHAGMSLCNPAIDKNQRLKFEETIRIQTQQNPWLNTFSVKNLITDQINL